MLNSFGSPPMGRRRDTGKTVGQMTAGTINDESQKKSPFSAANIVLFFWKINKCHLTKLHFVNHQKSVNVFFSRGLIHVTFLVY